jgi:hypothetical protein
MGQISIGPDEDAPGGIEIAVFASMLELNPATGTADFCRKVIMINSGTGTDPTTPSELTTGILIRGIGDVATGPGKDYTRISSHGVYTSGKGYSILSDGLDLSLTPESVANVVAVARGNTFGTVAGVYGEATNAGSSEAYAFYAQGNNYATGVTRSKGYCLNGGINHPANTSSTNLTAGYNIFINDNLSQNANWYLPNPALYQYLEEIEIVNWNDQDINLRPLTGDFINSFNNTQKRIYLPDGGNCCKLRSNGVDTWIIVSLYGQFTGA